MPHVWCQSHADVMHGIPKCNAHREEESVHREVNLLQVSRTGTWIPLVPKWWQLRHVQWSPSFPPPCPFSACLEQCDGDDDDDDDDGAEDGGSGQQLGVTRERVAWGRVQDRM